MADPGARAPARDLARWAAQDALNELYAAHWSGLVRLAHLLVRDRGRAEEVVQDAFVASLPRLARLREEGTALAYLRRAVVNGCRSGFRHQAVERRYLSARGADPDLPGRRTADSAETLALVRDDDANLLRLLHRLPQRQQEVLVLRYYADLSEQQIADVLQISTGSVKSHAHRALATLRSALGGAS